MNDYTGFIFLDKEIGISSAKALYAVKNCVPKCTKVGHAGTLDPFASGLLIVGVGKATRAIEYVMGMNKVYEFTVHWGIATNTDDCTGEVIANSTHIPSINEIENSLNVFRGMILQKPPAYSAIHISGKRAYDLARNGEKFDLPIRKVNVLRLDVISHHETSTKFIMECSKGCYVRSIARDLAEKLNTYGHVIQLRRTQIGKFSVLNSSMKIIPITEVLDFPILQVSESDVQKIRNGINIDIKIDERTILENQQCDFLCIAEMIQASLSLKRIL